MKSEEMVTAFCKAMFWFKSEEHLNEDLRNGNSNVKDASDLIKENNELISIFVKSINTASGNNITS